MSYTVSQLMNRAARRLRIIPAGDTLQAEDQADILDAYNSMMFGFTAAGLTLTDSATVPVTYTHATQAAGDTFPLADKHFDSVLGVLLERLIGQFPIDQSVAQGVANEISTGWSRLYGEFLVVDEADVQGMGMLQSVRDRFWG